jgi:alpha-L-fucosidase
MQNIYDRTMDAIQTFNPDLVYFDDVVLPFYPINEQLGLDIASALYNRNGRAVLLGKQLNAGQKQCMTWDVERGVPDVIQPDYWQTCTCLGQWHYDRGTYDRGHYKSAAQVIRMLVDIISKNGNMLLSVPLRADGTPDDKELAILDRMAAWMEVNGESIYGTRPWTCFGEGPVADHARPVSGFGFNEGARYSSADIRYVCKGRTVYATVLGRAEGEVLMRAFAPTEEHRLRVKRVRMLGGGRCPFALTADGLTITVPEEGADDIATVFAITLKK